MKQELVYNTYFYTKKQAKKEIFEYIEFYYNRVRKSYVIWEIYHLLNLKKSKKCYEIEMVA